VIESIEDEIENAKSEIKHYEDELKSETDECPTWKNIYRNQVIYWKDHLDSLIEKQKGHEASSAWMRIMKQMRTIARQFINDPMTPITAW